MEALLRREVGDDATRLVDGKDVLASWRGRAQTIALLRERRELDSARAEAAAGAAALEEERKKGLASTARKRNLESEARSMRAKMAALEERAGEQEKLLATLRSTAAERDTGKLSEPIPRR
ncbi:hypothetical protein WJX81_002994 [Elliptochloris bilobata]|uniref:Uncharacterized protein n=1 Tax=Elliptochloris bilobata TaxID=381761 RepID=A0AAW1QMF8_9CHLO